MWPDRVGGIAATCAEAFRRYNPVLANLTGVCYWWGWVPTCGLTALLSSQALHDWYLPGVPVTPMAVGIVIAFAVLNLSGIARVSWVVKYIAAGAASLALLSAVLPLPARRRQRLPSHVMAPAVTVPRRIRRRLQRDGRAVPHRLRRAGLRGRNLSRRRDA